MTMKLATVSCHNPSCSAVFETVLDANEWHAACPSCGQVARVPGQAMSKEIDGLCVYCRHPLDLHMYGRFSFCCPPGVINVNETYPDA
jgi:hypothetical protein